jgi:hypothetical protein
VRATGCRGRRINYRFYLPAKEARDAASLGKYLPLIKKAG